MFRAHPKPWAGKKETRRFGRAFVAGGSISLFQPMLPPYIADILFYSISTTPSTSTFLVQDRSGIFLQHLFSHISTYGVKKSQIKV